MPCMMWQLRCAGLLENALRMRPIKSAAPFLDFGTVEGLADPLPFVSPAGQPPAGEVDYRCTTPSKEAACAVGSPGRIGVLPPGASRAALCMLFSGRAMVAATMTYA